MTPNRYRFERSLLLTLLTLAVACGGSERCRIEGQPDGSKRMRCPDGSSVLLPSTEETQPPGGIRGIARYFGRDSNAGIRIEVIGEGISAETDERGAFELAPVPAGFHELRIDADGYEEQTREKVMVLPGAFATEEIELRIGRRVLDGGGWRLIPSPRRDIFLVQREDLILVDPLTLRTELLAAEVQQVAFSPDGTRVVIVAGGRESARPSELLIYEVDRRVKTSVATEVIRWRLAPGGDSIVYERRPEGRVSLEVWHHPTARRSSVARDVIAWRLSDDGGALLAAAQTSIGHTLVAWELAAGGGTGLGDYAIAGSDPLPQYAPDGRSFLYPNRLGDMIYWDGQRHEASLLEPWGDDFVFSPGGDQLIYLSGGALIHRDLRLGVSREIATSVVRAIFSPDGKVVAYFRNTGTAMELVTWDRESRASQVRAAASSLVDMQFAPSGSHLFYTEGDGLLWSWSAAGLRRRSTQSPLPLFAPDGRSFLHLEGEELHWSELDGESIFLGAPVLDYPVKWDADGSQLFFVTGLGDAPPSAFGDAWLFRKESLVVERVGRDSFLSSANFVESGGLLLLRRFDREASRGELALDGGAIGSGVPGGYRFTPDASRLLFRTDALPIRETGVLALWEPPRLESVPNREEPIARGGLVPADSNTGNYLLAADYLAWTTSSDASEERAGLYISHYPRDLPSLHAPAPALPGDDGERAPSRREP